MRPVIYAIPEGITVDVDKSNLSLERAPATGTSPNAEGLKRDAFMERLRLLGLCSPALILASALSAISSAFSGVRNSA